jgi:hypothetical protein
MDIEKQVTAYVHHVGDDMYCLHVNLGNDHTITITYRRDEAPRIGLVSGNGKRIRHPDDLECVPFPDDIEYFREFVADAFEPLEVTP